MKDEQYPCQTGCRRTLDGHSGWVQAETMGASRGVSEVQGPRWHRLRGGSVPARGYREGSRRNAEGVSLISRYKQTYQVTPPRRTHGRNGSTGAERWASLDGRKRKMGGSGHSGVPLFRGGVGLRGGGGMVSDVPEHPPRRNTTTVADHHRRVPGEGCKSGKPGYRRITTDTALLLWLWAGWSAPRAAPGCPDAVSGCAQRSQATMVTVTSHQTS